MPYIKFENRIKYAPFVGPLAARLDGEPPGEFNYVITRLLNEGLDLTSNPSYDKLNTALGILEAVKLELYRRVAAPYEERKREENGDVY